MKVNRIEDLLSAHQTFAQQMQQQMQQFSQQGGASVAIPDKKAQLKQYEQQLRTATEAKAATVRRYDEDIRRYSDAIARLKQEIKTAAEVKPQQTRKTED
ncbi:MAG: hypothetical protein ACTS3T_07310 [Almyronema sp.]